MSVSGGRAFVTTTEGFAVVDLAAPSDPLVLGFAETSGDIGVGVFVDSQFAYIAALVLQPQVASIQEGFQGRDLELDYSPTPPKGALLIVEMGYGAPNVVGRLEIDTPVLDVFVSGTRAFLATGEGLVIADVSVPSQPRVVGTLSDFGVAFSVFVIDEHAFVGTADGLYRVDVSDPNQPDLVDKVPLVGGVTDVLVMDDLIGLVTSEWWHPYL